MAVSGSWVPKQIKNLNFLVKNVQTKVVLMVDLVPLDLVYAAHVSCTLQKLPKSVFL